MFSSDQFSSSTSKGRFTLVSAIVKRKDDVYRGLVDEFKTIENVLYTQKKKQYHSSCYKSFTRKHNLSAFVFSTTARNVSNTTENITSVSSLVLTRSSRSSDIRLVCMRVLSMQDM